jgi:CLIP-associating protein 1/2
MLKGQAHADYRDAFLQGIKTLSEGISKAVRGSWFPSSVTEAVECRQLVSLRTTLANSACALVSDLAQGLQRSLDPLIDQLLATLLKLNATTKKILATASDAAIRDLILSCSYSRRMATMLTASLAEKTVQARQLASGQVALLLDTHKASAEAGRDGELFGQALAKGIADANPIVRQNCRAAFWTYHDVWPRDAQRIMDTLEPAIRAQLEKAKGGEASLSASVESLPGGRPKAAARPSVRQLISAQRRAPLSASTSSASLPTLAAVDTESESMPPPASTSPISSRRPIARTPSTSRKSRAPSSTSSASKHSSAASSPPMGTSRSAAAKPSSNQSTPTRPAPQPSSSAKSASRPAAQEGDVSPLSSRLAAASIAGPSTSRGSTPDRMAVDEIRAQAHQAEAAAERLLELGDDDLMATLPQPSFGSASNGRMKGSSARSDVARPALDSWWVQQASRASSSSSLMKPGETYGAQC